MVRNNMENTPHVNEFKFHQQRNTAKIDWRID